jgi:transposase
LVNQLLPALFERPPAVVVMEACSEAFAVAEAARSRGHTVRVVPATLVRALGVGQRQIKTDRRDAQALSEASCRIDLPSVHIPTPWSRQAKSLCGMRDGLVSARVKLINTVRGWLRTQLAERRPSRAALTKALRAHYASRNEQMPAFVERQLAAIDQLTEQIKAADAAVAELAAQSEICRLLLTAPGVGAKTAVRYAATLDEVSRFPSAANARSYLGTTPGEDSSSLRKRNTSITKAGSSQVRWLLVQAAWTALRTRPQDPMCLWARRVAMRRGKCVAAMALARKLAGVLYAIWRDRKPYDPAR